MEKKVWGGRTHTFKEFAKKVEKTPKMKIKPELPKHDKMKSYRKKPYIQLKKQESVKSFSFTKPKDLFGQKIFLDVDASP